MTPKAAATATHSRSTINAIEWQRAILSTLSLTSDYPLPVLFNYYYINTVH